MKKNIFLVIYFTIILSSCSIFSSITSQTTIDVGKSFILGQGKHRSYSAEIKNVGKAEIEVIQTNENNVATSLGILRIGDKKKYAVSANTSVEFKNKSDQEKAVINIFLKGDTNLSMGYK